ncbi:Uncharacterised protein [Serratia proteamaculans]|uniref:NIPSNAP family protein n=1 Tax=Serratia proteamaculans TaxID=28151 RepID=UPI00217979DF|nr:NIPSNAP family protein [Serratia proteamaculans]CAI0839099.1 Uncharacterised protein [Serratia proteamaculans]
MKTVEFLLYILKPSTGKDFHRIMKEVSVPLHSQREWMLFLLIYQHDDDAYYLISAYDILSHLKTSQDSFYDNEGWSHDPRQAIIDRISVSVKSVLTLSESVLEHLRTN